MDQRNPVMNQNSDAIKSAAGGNLGSDSYCGQNIPKR